MRDLIDRINQIIFQSTLSVRRAAHHGRDVAPDECISIHALREESGNRHHHRQTLILISIHALREESGAARRSTANSDHNFNPRSP